MSIDMVHAKFEKVSKEEYAKSFPPELISDKREEFDKMYNDIKLPTRATKQSAGYDFFLPFPIVDLCPGCSVLIPTGIKVRIDPGWCLFLMPKSGLGFKYRLQLDNTIGLIDADYYNNESNEGHIMVSLTNDLKESQNIQMNRITNKPEFVENSIINLPTGKSFVQGVLLPFGIADSDNANAVRTGGLGSTN